LKMMFKILCVLLSLLIVLTPFAGTVRGDRGGMPISTVHIDIHEPGQKAIICWDGAEEILVLSTDMRADSPTKVLEIMPLPAAPEIKTANETLFRSLKNLVEEHSVTYKDEAGGLNDRGGDGGEPVDVEIIFHDKLGVHNLTVIKALTKEGFANFVAEFMFKPKTYFDFAWWVWVGAVGFGVLFCFLGTIFPANRAAKMEPADAPQQTAAE